MRNPAVGPKATEYIEHECADYLLGLVDHIESSALDLSFWSIRALTTNSLVPMADSPACPKFLFFSICFARFLFRLLRNNLNSRTPLARQLLC